MITNQIANQKMRSLKTCIFSIPIEDIATAQRSCPQLAPIINYLTTGELPEDNDKLSRRILFHKDDYFLNKNNTLMRKCEVREKNLNRLHPVIEQVCILLSQQKLLVHKVHVQTSHQSHDRLYALLRAR